MKYTIVLNVTGSFLGDVIYENNNLTDIDFKEIINNKDKEDVYNFTNKGEIDFFINNDYFVAESLFIFILEGNDQKNPIFQSDISVINTINNSEIINIDNNNDIGYEAIQGQYFQDIEIDEAFNPDNLKLETKKLKYFNNELISFTLNFTYSLANHQIHDTFILVSSNGDKGIYGQGPDIELY